MDRTERFYKIDRLLQRSEGISMNDLLGELEVSKATIKRDLTYMRDRLHAPIIWDLSSRRYRYEDPRPGFKRFSLPGLWFNSSELHSLLIMEHLIKHLQPGFLASHVDPLRTRVRTILEKGERSVEEIVHRVRIVSGSNPPVDSEIFQKIADAVFNRKQIYISYFNRHDNQTVFRHVSPQRLVYYNENWYLDSWCHLRNGLRTFRLSYLSTAELTQKDATEIDDAQMNLELQAGFGIFGGTDTSQAVLRFSAAVSPWVKHEYWHSGQTQHFDDDGTMVMTLPFSKDPELIMKLLRYGPDVEVLEPVSLRQKIAKSLRAASALYSD